MDLRFFYVFAVILAIATSVGVAEFWIDHVQAQQATPVESTQQPLLDGSKTGIAVSIPDDDKPKPAGDAQTQKLPAYDSKALDARIDEVLRGTLDPAPAAKTKAPGAPSKDQAAPATPNSPAPVAAKAKAPPKSPFKNKSVPALKTLDPPVPPKGQAKPAPKIIPVPVPAAKKTAPAVPPRGQAKPAPKIIPVPAPAAKKTAPAVPPRGQAKPAPKIIPVPAPAAKKTAPAVPPRGQAKPAPKIIPVPAPAAKKTAPGKPPKGQAAPAPQTIPAPVPPVAAAPKDVPLEKKIGQMLIFGFQGSKAEQKWPKAVARQIQKGELGGVIFLGFNFKTKRDTQRLMKLFRGAGKKAALPPFIMVDQEGGRVQRLGPKVGVKKLPSHAVVGRRSLEAARTGYDKMAKELKAWGFNVNLGPVTDVNLHPASPAIGKLGRSFSANPSKVSNFAGIFVEAHRQHGILTALKHFPGHGSAKKDSHLGFTDISQSWRKTEELLPYRELISSGRVDMVMIGHLYLSQFQNKKSKDKYPATLSPEIITGLLRQELGYRGVVISDDMEMKAIRKLYPTYEAAIRAIKAGVDMLIISNSAKPKIGAPGKYIAEIAKAAGKDTKLRARIDEAYTSILKLKQHLDPKKVQQAAADDCEASPTGGKSIPSVADNCQYNRTATPADPQHRAPFRRPAATKPTKPRG